MLAKVDRAFGEKFLTSIDDFYGYGVHLLFNDWWEKAPADAIAKYVAAMEADPDVSALARERYFAPPLDVTELESFAPGTLGHAYRDFMLSNDLMEGLAEGYRDLHDQFVEGGKLDRMPDLLKYRVLRGYQTHDLHHVLTGYPATPFGELGLQTFQLAQMNFPYSAMWIAVVTGHMALVDPWLIKPAMDAIVHGWTYGREARSLQLVKFEEMLDRPLDAVRGEYCLGRDCSRASRPNPADLPQIIPAAA